MMSGDVFSVPISSTKIFPQELEQNPNPKPTSNKKRRNLPGTPDAEVIALSPTTLMAKNRFLCEICNKGFQRDQNLQLHRRGHNLPWKLKQRANKDQIKKKVYICPEKTCVHHDPARALGDLTGVKKHFSRKHGEKKWKCEKCSKKYAVQSDWKAHSKTCGTREYKCDCGTLFSRRDSFITHRAFCDALAEESSRITASAPNLNFGNDSNSNLIMNSQLNNLAQRFSNSGSGIHHLNPTSFVGAGNSVLMEHHQQKPRLSLWLDLQTNSQLINNNNPMDHQSSNLYIPSNNPTPFPDQIMQMSSNFGSNYANNNLSLSPLPPPQNQLKEETMIMNKGSCTNTLMADSLASLYNSDHQNQTHNNPSKSSNSIPMSATALLQKAAQMGSTKSNPALFGNTTTHAVGLMNSSSSSSAASPSANTLSFNNPFTQNRSELHQVFGKNPDQISVNPTCMKEASGNKMMNFGSSTSGALMNLDSGLRGVDQNGLTRDFLGMGGGDDGGGGGGGGGPMFFPQELANLASMSSAMVLSHFSSNHHQLS
ncbi:zinc finger protein JACKDAW-like isoform X2 [Henckelia pumila]|uniref:zinc finger protein JACKDAW-like isoform X2 n=1 Tax=Henckelia pumila TaxID=405737 RepID=UPI003C6DE95E